MTEALRGKVKWFNNAKGFGFIENGDGDVFVHYSVIESDGFRSLKDGDEVIYEIQRGPKGLQAAKVSKVKTDSEDAVPASGLESNVMHSGSLGKPVVVADDAGSALSMQTTAIAVGGETLGTQPVALTASADGNSVQKL